MDLTPKLLTEGTDFQQVRRGYDPDEVDDFLERVAAAVSRLQGQLVEANRRAEIAEAKAAQAGPADTEGSPLEEMQRTLVLAQRTADAAVREAREEADSILAAARREVATVLTNGRQEADRYAAESRLSLANEVRELEQRRDAISGELTALEQHVEHQRDRLRSAVEELQRVVDDPDAFRVERPAGFEDPAPAAPEPEAVAEPEPFEPARHEPDVFATDAAPAEAATEVPSGQPTYAPPFSAPQPDPSRTVPSAFGPPPDGAVQTMASPPTVASIEAEAPAPPKPADQLIDLTHERPMPAGQEEDEFLAELRKAMTDDEPLGPREEQPGVVRTIGEVPLGRQRGRFGRRR
jgi:cell division initiation protein